MVGKVKQLLLVEESERRLSSSLSCSSLPPPPPLSLVFCSLCAFSLCYSYFFSRYSGWKSLFDAELLADPVIKANFNRALSLMDHASHGTLIPGMRENMVYFTTSERRCALLSLSLSYLYSASTRPSFF